MNKWNDFENTVADFYLSGETGDINTVFNEIVIGLKEDRDVFVPIYSPEDIAAEDEMEGYDDFDDSDITMRMLVYDDEDSYWYSAFTSEEEVEKAGYPLYIPITLRLLLDHALDDDICRGIKINNWGEGISLDRKSIELINAYEPTSRICLLQGDITKMHTDAIVNTANNTLLGGGGVDGAIHRAAGPGLLEECRTLKGCETGDAKLTFGYELNSKYVIHTVGPVYTGSAEDEMLLESCYIKCMSIAKKESVHSIAFPAISTGAYGFPVDRSARIAFRTVANWLKQNRDYLMHVYMCLYSEKDLRIYKDVFDNIMTEYAGSDFEKGLLSYKREKYPEAFDYFNTALKGGDMQSLAFLGDMYLMGKGVVQDTERAHICYEEAAAYGDPYAMIKLGDIYMERNDPDSKLRAGRYYIHAYETAKSKRDPLSYPEIGLRIIRYFRNRFDDETLRVICNDIIDCLRKRDADYHGEKSGDIYSETAYIRKKLSQK